jgi:SPP1 family holin
MKDIAQRLKSVAPGAWVRLALLIASLVGAGLRITGVCDCITDNETLENAVTVIVMVVVALASYWKNNSFTEAAQAADEVMNSMKK